jgi:hypothetical protein
MPIIAGSLSGRLWKATETPPAQFAELFERNLKRNAFRPTDPERGRLISQGWVNIRQMLDAGPTLKKSLFRNIIALGLRVDRITINQRMFRAKLAEEMGRSLREKGHERLSDEQRKVIEEKVRQELLKAQPPSTAVYEMAWHLESGLVIFGATSHKLNTEFADLFAETFNVSIEPQFPFLRAQRWAKRQRQERELIELLPTPFSPRAPTDVIDATAGDEED